MTEPVAAYNGPVMWADGNNLILIVDAPEGLLYQQTFPMAVFSAVIAGDGEIIRFTYDWTDPEDGQVTRGAARLVLQQLPDPRDQKTEEQPAAPADATVFPGFPSENEMVRRLFGEETAQRLAEQRGEAAPGAHTTGAASEA